MFSCKNKIKSAFIASSWDLFIPIDSTISFVFLSPAVSTKVIACPSKIIVDSIISLVVPAIGVTIAFSSSIKALKSEDFPAFTDPKSTTL